jgi:hypothetical protein
MVNTMDFDDLPEWKLVFNKDIGNIKDTMDFDLDLKLEEEHRECSRIGGKPWYINAGQAYRFERVVEQNNLEFIMQLSEEDFFLVDYRANLVNDQKIRTLLCGGVLYIYAKIDREKNAIDFSKNLIDHHA